MTPEERENLKSAEKHQLVFTEGQYLDQEMLDHELKMNLHCIHCTSSVGKLISLRAAIYNKLKNNDVLLAHNLHHQIFVSSPPMESRTEKATAQFLKLFKFHIFHKGKVL